MLKELQLLLGSVEAKEEAEPIEQQHSAEEIDRLKALGYIE